MSAEHKIGNQRIDLHIHSVGDHRDIETIDTAKKVGVVALAIGKRGGGILDNFEEISKHGRKTGVDVLPLTEYHLRLNELKFDIVCIGFNLLDPKVKNWKNNYIRWNKIAAQKNIKFLEEHGIFFSNLDQQGQRQFKNITNGSEPERMWTLSRLATSKSSNTPAIVKFIVSSGIDYPGVIKKYSDLSYVDTPQKLLSYVLARAFINQEAAKWTSTQPPNTNLDSFIETFLPSGLLFYSPEGNFNHKLWSHLREKGFSGVLVWHGSRMELKKSQVEELVRTNVLLIGGSDYDPLKNHWQPGIGDGNMFVGIRTYKKVEQALLAKKNV